MKVQSFPKLYFFYYRRHKISEVDLQKGIDNIFIETLVFSLDKIIKYEDFNHTTRSGLGR
jgi:hypothetical protein